MKILLFVGLLLFLVDDLFILAMKMIKFDWLKFFFPHRTRTVSSHVKEIKKGKRNNFIIRTLNEMEETLNKTGENSKIKTYKRISIGCGIVAALIVLFYRIYILAPIAFLGCSMIPMWFVKFKDYRYRLAVNAELSVALSSITNKYIRSENFVKAVSESIDMIKPPIRQSFETFLSNYTYINPSIEDNLILMKETIHNKVFALWVDNILRCLRDINHKNNLNAILDQLDSDRQVQDEVKLTVSKPISTMVLLMGVSMGVFPVLYIFDPLLIDVLFNSLVGQFLMSGLFISLLITTNQAVNISTTEAS